MNYESPTGLLSKVSELLQEPLAYDEVDKLREQLASIQSMQFEVMSNRVIVHTVLVAERERARMPRDKEYTEFDRKTMLDANTAVIQRDYDILVTAEEIISKRIELGITFLNTM